jgi:hypothetical protein
MTPAQNKGQAGRLDCAHSPQSAGPGRPRQGGSDLDRRFVPQQPIDVVEAEGVDGHIDHDIGSSAAKNCNFWPDGSS